MWRVVRSPPAVTIPTSHLSTNQSALLLVVVQVFEQAVAGKRHVLVHSTLSVVQTGEVLDPGGRGRGKGHEPAVGPRESAHLKLVHAAQVLALELVGVLHHCKKAVNTMQLTVLFLDLMVTVVNCNISYVGVCVGGGWREGVLGWGGVVW